MYTKYVFQNAVYDDASKNLKATLFDIVNVTEKQLSVLREKVYNTSDSEEKNRLIEIFNEQQKVLLETLDISKSLAGALEKLDESDRIISNQLGNEAVNETVKTDENKEINDDVKVDEDKEINETVKTDDDKVIDEDIKDNDNEADSMFNDNVFSSVVTDNIVSDDVGTGENLNADNNEQIINDTVTEDSMANTSSISNEEDQKADESLPDIDPIISIETTDPVIPIGNTEPVISVESSDSTISADNADPIISIETTDPVISADSVISAENTDPVISVENTEPVMVDVSAVNLDTTNNQNMENQDDVNQDSSPVIDNVDNSVEQVMSVEPVEQVQSVDNYVDSSSNNQLDSSEPVVMESPVVSGDNTSNSSSNDTVVNVEFDQIDLDDEGNSMEASSTINSVVNNQVDNNTSSNNSVVDGQVDNNALLTLKNKNNIDSKNILISKIQGSKLRDSYYLQSNLLNSTGFFQNPNPSNDAFFGDITEDALIANGVLPAKEKTAEEQIEEMMEEANKLYNEGKVEEAQQMYENISMLNKQLQDGQKVMAA